MDKFEKAISEATPEQFQTENYLRKKYNLALLKDPKQPKRPKNSFLFYMDHLRAIRDPAILGEPRSQVSEAAKKYKQLSESELKVCVYTALRGVLFCLLILNLLGIC
jgi:hypothetical protein